MKKLVSNVTIIMSIVSVVLCTMFAAIAIRPANPTHYGSLRKAVEKKHIPDNPPSIALWMLDMYLGCFETTEEDIDYLFSLGFPYSLSDKSLANDAVLCSDVPQIPEVSALWFYNDNRDEWVQDEDGLTRFSLYYATYGFLDNPTKEKMLEYASLFSSVGDGHENFDFWKKNTKVYSSYYDYKTKRFIRVTDDAWAQGKAANERIYICKEEYLALKDVSDDELTYEAKLCFKPDGTVYGDVDEALAELKEAGANTSHLGYLKTGNKPDKNNKTDKANKTDKLNDTPKMANRSTQLTALKLNINHKPVIKWKKLNGATGYRVYRKTPEDTKWVKVTTTKKTSITDTKLNVKSGSVVKYCVKPYYKDENGVVTWGKKSSSKKIIIE